MEPVVEENRSFRGAMEHLSGLIASMLARQEAAEARQRADEERQHAAEHRQQATEERLSAVARGIEQLAEGVRALERAGTLQDADLGRLMARLAPTPPAGPGAHVHRDPGRAARSDSSATAPVVEAVPTGRRLPSS